MLRPLINVLARGSSAVFLDRTRNIDVRSSRSVLHWKRRMKEETYYPDFESFTFEVTKIVVQPDKLVKATPKSFEVRTLKRGVVDASVSYDGKVQVQIIVDFRASFVRA